MRTPAQGAPRRPERSPDVVLDVDGEEVPACAGEPVAVALYAHGRRVLGRSVKYHRPRGAACFAGRCDGCAMRVDGAPSVPTCRVRARHGLRVETQNVVGSAEHDLLAATDWLFPAGMNHHEMFTWSQPANRAMQTVARQIAGVGTLPERALGAAPPRRVRCDVLVLGAGAAGLACAAAAARAGRSVWVLDEEDTLGGRLAWWPDEAPIEGLAARDDEPRSADAPRTPRALAAWLAAEATRAGARLAARTSAIGVFEETSGARVVLATDDEGPWVLAPRRLVIAQGRAETGAAFEGNDLPGVLGAEAGARLLARGVLPGRRPLLAGEGPLVEALARALTEAGAAPIGPVPLEALRRVRGRSGPRAAVLAGGDEVRCDAVLVASPEGGVFELGAQAGAEVRFDGAAFELVADPHDGRTRSPFVWVVGAAAGQTSLGPLLAHAGRAGSALAASLETPVGADAEASR